MMIKVLNRIIEVIIAVLITLMVLGNFWQILTRILASFKIGNPAGWTEEFLRYALIWLTMLGVPYAYGKNQHIAIEFITDKFSKKGKAIDEIAIQIIILLISVFVLIVGGSMVTANAAGQVSAALNMPMQFYYLGVPVCGVLMLVYTVPKLVEQIKVLRESKKEGN
jgi:TRAP-type C4-dicarboxylate transport system permease small subunit